MTRAEASRINGAKSRGPVTTEGREASSQNNYRHGLYSKRTVVLRSESREEYEESKDAYVQLFQPRNTFEAEAVIDIANARWKIRRIEKDATNLTDLRRSHDAPKHRAMLSNLTPETAETLALDSNCADKYHTLFMLLRAENSCQLAISRSLRNIEKSRKLIDPANNPPTNEILDATLLPINNSPTPTAPPPPQPGGPPPAPDPTSGSPTDQKSRFEPENPSQDSETKANNILHMPSTLILIVLLTALLLRQPARPVLPNHLQHPATNIDISRIYTKPLLHLGHCCRNLVIRESSRSDA